MRQGMTAFGVFCLAQAPRAIGVLQSANSNLQPTSKGERKPRIPNRPDMLLVEQIIELGEDRNIVRQDEGTSQVELRIAEVEIAVRKQ